MNKKGQSLGLDNLITVVLAMLFIGVMLSATVLIMDDGFEEEFKTIEGRSENFTLASNQSHAFSKAEFFGQIEGFTLYDDAGAAARVEITQVGNYTVTYGTAGSIIGLETSVYNTTEVEADYTYWIGNHPYNATMNVLSAQDEIGDWLDLVVIVAIAAIIILLILQFGKFGTGRR